MYRLLLAHCRPLAQSAMSVACYKRTQLSSSCTNQRDVGQLVGAGSEL
jgi:hypothetical protein